jgi:hypothetical protein
MRMGGRRYWARTKGHSGAVEALTQLGADVNAPRPSSVLADVLKLSLVPLLLLIAFYVFKRLFRSARTKQPRGRPARTPVAGGSHCGGTYSSEHAVSSSGSARSLRHCRRRCDSWLQAATSVCTAPHNGNALHAADAVSVSDELVNCESDAMVWHGATENGPRTREHHPHLNSCRTCCPFFGVQSCYRD